MATGTFDFSQVTFTFAGFGISGYGDVDDAITYSRRNDMWELIVGADGDSVFVKKGDKSGVVVAKLLPSSASNDTFSAIALAAENGIAVPSPLMVNDLNGRSLLAAAKCMCMKIPDGALGKNLGTNDWGILCADLDIFVGGMV